ncbi:hypothetical protein PENTCL1PPCAC_24245 [Pristionchus entomophagus]|uniref:G protein-coupled receptor n=1 Tax=Pristionchus entomophagus TaxID=358040 RepID=A0AAV5U7C7_9BILA|nr:hypothetical protein PENTCL1PPCAC_24245 [Pristionchus entomophagus]
MFSLPLLQITQPFSSRSILIRGRSSILNNLAGSNLRGSICIGIEIDSFQFLRSPSTPSNSPTGSPCHLVFLLIGPIHLKCLAGILNGFSPGMNGPF